MERIIYYLFLIMLTINIILFIFLLVKKIVVKLMDGRKGRIREAYEDRLTAYISSNGNTEVIKTTTLLEGKVLQELMIEYSSFLTGETKSLLLNLVDQKNLIKGIKNNIKSRNPWKQRIAVYEAGEFGIDEVVPCLLKLLESDQRELVYITARSLIKITGKEHLKKILIDVSSRNIMEKSNILYLMELVEEDIVDILEELMEEESSLFIKAICLETYGNRQYTEGLKWISQMVSHPSKEVRISVLKAAIGLGDIDEEDFIKNLTDLKSDSQWEVRAFLAKYLKTVKNIDSVGLLEKLMKDSNWFVRHNAAMALVKQGEDGLISLVALLDSEDPFARDKAWEVVQREMVHNQLLVRIAGGELKERLLEKSYATELEVG